MAAPNERPGGRGVVARETPEPRRIATTPQPLRVSLAAPPFRAEWPQRNDAAPAEGRGISCVPYARLASGVQVTGNGGDWWRNASGLYARGQQPEPGAVFAFRRTSGMPSGHVAVVERLVGPRHITIHHANWAGPGIRRGSVMRNVHVIDVSEENDWSAVRVQSGTTAGAFGRVYPTFGFIYNRPDRGGDTLFAGTPLRRGAPVEELAEAPANTRIALSPAPQASRRR